MRAKRRRLEAGFKAKVGLEALKGIKTVAQIAREYQVHLLAIAVASPWVLAAVAAKLLTRGATARTLATVRWIVAAIGLLGIALWLIGMCQLAAGLDLNNLTSGSVLVPDRRLALIGQLLAEFRTVSFFIITGMIEFWLIAPPSFRTKTVSASPPALPRSSASCGLCLRSFTSPKATLRSGRHAGAASSRKV